MHSLAPATETSTTVQGISALAVWSVAAHLVFHRRPRIGLLLAIPRSGRTLPCRTLVSLLFRTSGRTAASTMVARGRLPLEKSCRGTLLIPVPWASGPAESGAHPTLGAECERT